MRRCTVYVSNGWDRGGDYPRMAYEGWLVEIGGPNNNDYPKCVVADLKGQMRMVDLSHVQLHVPTAIDLISGAPRRGE